MILVTALSRIIHENFGVYKRYSNAKHAFHVKYKIAKKTFYLCYQRCALAIRYM